MGLPCSIVNGLAMHRIVSKRLEEDHLAMNGYTLLGSNSAIFFFVRNLNRDPLLKERLCSFRMDDLKWVLLLKKEFSPLGANSLKSRAYSSKEGQEVNKS